MTEKNLIGNLNKVFDNRLRLGIMAALSVNKSLSFNELKEILQVTDGNLASHIKLLEENNYISEMKGYIGRKTNTLYAVTTAGKEAFKQHLNVLAQMIDTVSN